MKGFSTTSSISNHIAGSSPDSSNERIMHIRDETDANPTFLVNIAYESMIPFDLAYHGR